MPKTNRFPTIRAQRLWAGYSDTISTYMSLHLKHKPTCRLPKPVVKSRDTSIATQEGAFQPSVAQGSVFVSRTVAHLVPVSGFGFSFAGRRRFSWHARLEYPTMFRSTRIRCSRREGYSLPQDDALHCPDELRFSRTVVIGGALSTDHIDWSSVGAGCLPRMSNVV